MRGEDVLRAGLAAVGENVFYTFSSEEQTKFLNVDVRGRVKGDEGIGSDYCEESCPQTVGGPLCGFCEALSTEEEINRAIGMVEKGEVPSGIELSF